jgi:diguanylate cyclase (GGDEF)-like protein
MPLSTPDPAVPRSDPPIPAPGTPRSFTRPILVRLAPLVPLILLSFIFHADILPRLASSADRRMEWLVEALLLATGLLVIAGCRWGRTAVQPEATSGKPHIEPPLDDRLGEIGSIVRSVSQMLETIETQAQEINRSATRLDAAYKELEGANARLEASVNTEVTAGKDSLTGLYTRQFFKVRLEEEVNRYTRFGHPVSVVLIDLDQSEPAADARAAGDDTLRDVADLLLRHSRGINVIARYGGAEFAVLLVETSKLGAQRYADRVRGIIASAEWPGRPLAASFGVASLPEDVPASSEELVRAAHSALCLARRRGKNSMATYQSGPSDPVHAGELSGA